MKKYLLAGLTIACLATVPAQAANLIYNGSFEISSNTGFNEALGTGTEWYGWTVSGDCGTDCVAFFLYNYFEPGFTFPVADGVGAMDLTGSFNNLVGGLFQNVATTPGTEYTLDFYVGNQGSGSSTRYNLPTSIELLIDDSSHGYFTNADYTDGTANWALRTHSFTAQSGTTKIEFRNATTEYDGAFAGLDGISLVEGVPEPGTMSLLGLSLAVLAARRLKSSVR